MNVDDGSQSSGEIVFREIGLLLNILFPLSGRNFKPGSPNVRATMLENVNPANACLTAINIVIKTNF